MGTQTVSLTPTQLAARTKRADFYTDIAIKAAQCAAKKQRGQLAFVFMFLAHSQPEPCTYAGTPPLIPVLEETAGKGCPFQLTFDFDVGGSFANITPLPEGVRPKIEDIQRAVMLRYNVPREKFFSRQKTSDLVQPRQVSMYLCRTLAQRSHNEIGRRHNRRDHTTVVHAVQKIAWLVGDRTGRKPAYFGKEDVPVDLTLAADIEKLTAHFRP